MKMAGTKHIYVRAPAGPAVLFLYTKRVATADRHYAPASFSSEPVDGARLLQRPDHGRQMAFRLRTELCPMRRCSRGLPEGLDGNPPEREGQVSHSRALGHALTPSVERRRRGCLFVAKGVVGTPDMGADAHVIFPLRDRIRSGALLGPEIVLSGPMLDDAPAGFPYRRPTKTQSEARIAVCDLKHLGL